MLKSRSVVRHEMKKKNRHGRWRLGSVRAGLSSDFPAKEIIEHIGHKSGVPEKNLQNEFGRCPAKADFVSVRIGKAGFSPSLFPMEIPFGGVDKEIGEFRESAERIVSVLITLPRNEFVVPATQDNVILCGGDTSHSGGGAGVVSHNHSLFDCLYYIILTFGLILSKNLQFFSLFFGAGGFPNPHTIIYRPFAKIFQGIFIFFHFPETDSEGVRHIG